MIYATSIIQKMIQQTKNIPSNKISQEEIRHYRGKSIQRDFTCPCGKSYASYAAVYTHIRNKHNRDKKLISEISRPSWQNKQKGRPQNKKTGFLSPQIQKINILQMGLLKFHKEIVQVYPVIGKQCNQIFLSGNQILNLDETFLHYQELNNKQLKTVFSIFDDHQDRVIQVRAFFMNFAKHLSPQFSSRVLMTLNQCVFSFYKANITPENILFQGFTQVATPIMQEIWFGKLEVAKIIVETFNEILKNQTKISLDEQNDKFIDQLLQFKETTIDSQ